MPRQYRVVDPGATRGLKAGPAKEEKSQCFRVTRNAQTWVQP